MELVHQPLVCGPQKRAGLFWFATSPVLTDPVASDSEVSPPPLPWAARNHL